MQLSIFPLNFVMSHPEDHYGHYEKRHLSSVHELEFQQELKRETGRLVLTLKKYPQGLSKAELLHVFYEDYLQSSLQRRQSLEVCLNKMLQRARARFRRFGVCVTFCRDKKVWLVRLESGARFLKEHELHL